MLAAGWWRSGGPRRWTWVGGRSPPPPSCLSRSLPLPAFACSPLFAPLLLPPPLSPSPQPFLAATFFKPFLLSTSSNSYSRPPLVPTPSPVHRDQFDGGENAPSPGIGPARIRPATHPALPRAAGLERSPLFAVDAAPPAPMQQPPSPRVLPTHLRQHTAPRVGCAAVAGFAGGVRGGVQWLRQAGLLAYAADNTVRHRSACGAARLIPPPPPSFIHPCSVPPTHGACLALGA